MSRLWLLFLVSVPLTLAAQDGLYIGPGSIFTVDSSALVSVIGNVEQNAGASGNVSLHRHSVFYFYGVTWNQGANSPVSGSGKLRFRQPQPSPYGGNTSQRISGNSNGSYINNISVENSKNIQLNGSDLFVRDSLIFVAGHIILNRKNLVMGLNSPGTISGYDSLKYVVTNHINSSDSGFLVRRSIGSSSGNIIFPVGYDTTDYTPAQLSNSGTTDTFKVRVFRNVYSEGNSGILQNNESVGRTWQILDAVPGNNNISLTLQHNAVTEGSVYKPLRDHHYISRYAGYSGNNGGDTSSGSNWDLLFYSGLGAGTSPGTLTSGSSQNGAVMTTRTGLDTLGMFTKTTYSFTPLPLEILNLEGEWAGNDAQITWTTASEENISGFEIQRSNDGISFEYAGMVSSKAAGGISSEPIQYAFTDKNRRDGRFSVHYYRLKIIEMDGSTSFSPWVRLNEGAGITVRAYPNPATDWYRIETGVGLKGPAEVIIYDQSGKQVNVFTMSTNSLLHELDVRNYPEGLYYVQLNYGDQRWMFRMMIGK